MGGWRGDECVDISESGLPALRKGLMARGRGWEEAFEAGCFTRFGILLFRFHLVFVCVLVCTDSGNREEAALSGCWG